MSTFTVVQIEHGYVSTEPERRIVTAAGGRFIDAESRPLEEALIAKSLRLVRESLAPDGVFLFVHRGGGRTRLV